MVAETEEVTVEMGMKRTKVDTVAFAGYWKKAIPLAAGFVVAREVGGLVVDMIRQKKIAGRGFLLVGAPGCRFLAW
ncbi:hypothetical protein L1987_75100 [Smallanthus sonchifolius]|uniref:Uncharacterized protein n=1 Tax=Smallanthus sonchifolius TaxID=185202 RepID=A0ACB9A4I4_9ASTR|nr:hypothetical protein L1987_75100 [Smallanthus sonchifolius]